MNEYIVTVTQTTQYLIEAINEAYAEQIALDSDTQNGDIEILDVVVMKKE